MTGKPVTLSISGIGPGSFRFTVTMCGAIPDGSVAANVKEEGTMLSYCPHWSV